MSILIADKFAAWEQEVDERFNTLKANEEELNRIFIEIYGLQDELTPEVEEKVHHLADMQIEIDLDDGVKRNYELFADVLAKI